MDDKEVIKFLNAPDNVMVGSATEKCIIKTLQDTILSKQDFVSLLKRWKIDSTRTLINMLNELFINEIPDEVRKDFFLKNISKMMSLENEAQIRDNLVDITFALCPLTLVTDLSQNEYQSFLNEVYSKYIPAISQLRDSNYSNWHKLWMFLIKFCGKKIHNSMDLTNRLLRIVEYAFRNSSCEQRLKGYDCWKELIDNASLDPDHISTPKQIKLLVTPLRAKFSKQEIVICKRFDVFIHLLEKLQNKAVLCLPEFLEFCFGPVGDSKDNSRSGQAKSVPQILAKSAKVLVAILGHSHTDNVECVSDEIKFKNPIINGENIHNFYKVLINSMAECCSLLKDNNLENKRKNVIKCMWKSIFNVIISAPESERNKYFVLVAEILERYLKLYKENQYFEDLLRIIFKTLMSFDGDCFDGTFPLILKQLITIFISIDVGSSDHFKDVVTGSFSKVILEENKLKMIQTIMDCLANQTIDDNNLANYSKMWILLANELNTDCDREKLTKFSKFDDFFMWPSHNLHRIYEANRKQVIFYWMNLYRKVTVDNESKKIDIMEDLKKSFKNNPLLSSNISFLLNVMSQFELKISANFVTKLMETVSLVLQLPNLQLEDQNKLSSLVMQYFDPTLECYKSENVDEMIKPLCTCIEYILSIHYNSKIVDPLIAFIDNCSENVKLTFSKYLKDFSSELWKKESDNSNSTKAKELNKIVNIFSEGGRNIEEEKKTFVIPSGRSARIAYMGKNSPTSPYKTTKPNSTLRLFGKDPETMSPLKVKGSQLNNASSNKKKKSANVLDVRTQTTRPINEENSLDFVTIDTEVKLQPDKLSEHQKEILKKRREDIPALYQDLSQSISQDVFSSNSNSKELLTEQIAPPHPASEVDLFSQVSKELPRIEETKETNESDKDIPEAKIDEEKIIEDSKSGSLFSNLDQKIEEPNIFNSLVSSRHSLPATTKDLEKTSLVESLSYLTSSAKSAHSRRSSISIRTEDEDPVARRKRREIERLKMDIVGADKFFESPNRTRVKKPKKGEESQNKKSKNENKTDDEKTQNSGANSQNIIDTIEEVINTDRRSIIPESPRKNRGRSKEKKDVKNEASEITKPESKLLPESSKISNGRSKKKDLEEKNNTVTESGQSEDNKKCEVPSLITDSPTKNKKRSRLKKQPLETEKNQKDSIDPPMTNEVTEHTPDRSKYTEKKNIDTSIKSNSKRISENGAASKSRSAKVIEKLETSTQSKRKVKRMKTKQSEEAEKTIETAPLKEIPLETPKNVNVGMTKKKKLQDLLDQESMVLELQDVLESKGEKRKKTNEGSEDVIESSQESFVELIPLLNSSKKRSSRLEETKLAQDEDIEIAQNEKDEAALIQGYLLHLPDQIEIINEEADSKKHQELQKDTCNSQDTTITQDNSIDTEDTLSRVSALDTFMQAELFMSEASKIKSPEPPKKPQLTESELVMCQMDTMTICGIKESDEKVVEEIEPVPLNSIEDILATPSTDTAPSSPSSPSSPSNTPGTPKRTQNLPSSPVTVDTPNRTSELLNNTMDISPINSRCNSEEDVLVPVAKPIQIDFDELEIVGAVDEEGKSGGVEKVGVVEPMEEIQGLVAKVQKFVNDEEKDDSFVDGNSSDDFETIDASSEAEVTTMESAEEMNVEHFDFQVPTFHSDENVMQNGQVAVVVNNVSVGGGFREPSSTIQERSSKLQNLIHYNKPFAKRKGGTTSSPSTMRIKKLFGNINQKHLNQQETVENFTENDILTFSREIPSPLAVPRSSILKRKFSDSSEGEGISPLAKRKRVNFSDPCLTSKKLFIKDDYQPSLEAKRLFDMNPERKSTEDHLKDIFDYPDDSPCTDFSTETDSDHAETEPANPKILHKNKAIFPKLVECKDDVLVIVKRITSPMFVPALMNKLKGKNIKTIGDLARLSESEVNRFPFKVPVVANVLKALENYHRKKGGGGSGDGRPEEKLENCRDDEKRNGEVEMPKLDIKLEFKMLIKRAQREKLPTDELAKILLPYVDHYKLQPLIKSHCPSVALETLEEKDYTSVLKIIIDTKGISEILKRAHVTFHNANKEYEFYQAIADYVKYTVPLEKFFRGRSIEDLEVGIEESIKNKVFQKSEIIENCLLPLIETPKDISSYLNSLSIVHFDEIVIERLNQEGARVFFQRIINSCSSEEQKKISNALWCQQTASPLEVVDCFKKKLESQTEQDRNESMMEMFKFITDELDVKTLVGLHIVFLSRISGLLEHKK